MLDKQIEHAVDYFGQHQIKVVAHMMLYASKNKVKPKF